MKYKVSLHVLGVGDSREDFEKLQGIIDRLADLTDFRIVIEQKAVEAQDIASMIAMVPRGAFDPTHKDVYGQEEWPGFDWNKAMK